MLGNLNERNKRHASKVLFKGKTANYYIGNWEVAYSLPNLVPAPNTPTVSNRIYTHWSSYIIN